MEPFRTLKFASKQLKRRFDAGSQHAISRVTAVRGPVDNLKLQHAQHVIAVEAGFHSWGAMLAADDTSVGLAAVMLDMPSLTPEGIRLANPGRFKGRLDRRHALLERRRELRACVEDVEWSIGWLRRNIAPIASINRKSSSYRLKHIAEKEAPSRYLSNGVMIAAALISGFKRFSDGESLSLWFNMSQRSIGRLSS